MRLLILACLLCLCFPASLGAAPTCAIFELTVLIGDKDCYGQTPPECVGPDVAELNGMPYAVQPFYGRTDSVMNDNFPMYYDFEFALPQGAQIVSAFITINALDVESMGDGDSTPVVPLLDGVTLTGRALHSVPVPWGSPGPSDRYSTQTVFDVSDQRYVLEDGFAQLEFPAGNHGDNVAFDFVELRVVYSTPVPSLSLWGVLILVFAVVSVALLALWRKRVQGVLSTQ